MSEGAYGQALGNLAGMMAGGMGPGMGQMGGEQEQESMVPCPVCQGTGQVTEDVASALGGGMPASLTMRTPPQLSPMMMGGGQPTPPMMMGA